MRLRCSKIPDVLHTIKLNDAVAVVGSTVEAVFKARGALKVTWKGGATAGYDSERALGEYAARAGKLEEKGLSYRNRGDAAEALGKAAKVVSAEYLTDYVHHAQMEPMNATVSVNAAGDGAEILDGHAGPDRHRRRRGSVPQDHARQDQGAPAAPGRRLRPARVCGSRDLWAGDLQGGEEAGEADLDARAGREGLLDAAADGPPAAGGARRRRRSGRLAPSRRRRSRQGPTRSRLASSRRRASTRLRSKARSISMLSRLCRSSTSARSVARRSLRAARSASGRTSSRSSASSTSSRMRRAWTPCSSA